MSRLHGPLEADDTRAMRAGLAAFGVSIDDNDDPWLVLGTGGSLELPTDPIDALESGTTARFLAPFGALVNGSVTITGGGRLASATLRRTRPGPGTGWGVGDQRGGGIATPNHRYRRLSRAVGSRSTHPAPRSSSLP